MPIYASRQSPVTTSPAVCQMLAFCASSMSSGVRSVEPSIFILGPPCVGKHTLGRHVAHYLRRRILDEDCKAKGYVLTGFPATAEEGKALQVFGIFPEKISNWYNFHNVLKSRVSGKVIDRLTKEPYHKLYNPPSDPEVESRLVAADDTSDIECRIAKFRHHFVAIGQMYADIIVNLRADQPLSDLYSQAICNLSRPTRNPTMWTPRVLLLGFSGSGRKTVGDKLAKRYELVLVHCGTLIRREVIRETKLGNAMKIYVDTHGSVPDEMVIKLLQARLSELDCTLKGWVLFGFPRTRLQAQMLDEVDLAPNRVFFLNIGHNDAAARLNVRRVDVVTGARYDLCRTPPPTTPPPLLERVAGRVGRPPGMAECEVSLKLTLHAAHRDELVEYYGSRALHVNADREEEAVFEQVEFFLVNKLPRPARINPLANLKEDEKVVLEEYFKQHRIMEIFEALVFGLCVLLPPKPRDWLKDNLKTLSLIPILRLSSDVLIPEHMRPLVKKLGRHFSYRDYMLQHLGPPVDPRKMDIAREFSKRNDQRKYLRKWKRLVEGTKATESSDDRTDTAQICYARKTMNKFLAVWRDYVRRRRMNIIAFCNTMKEVERNIRLSISFQSLKAWVFGEVQISPGGFHQLQRDWFAELPERVQRKIFFYLTPMDFARCAMVNQAWKVAVDLNAATIDLDLSKISSRVTNSMLWKLLHQRRKKVKRVTNEGSTINIWNGEMKSLCIYGDERLRDFAFGRQCSEKLTKLVVVNCPNVEDQILERLVKLENLRCLNLSHCYRLTDRCAALISGSGYTDRLQELYLAYCYELTGSGVLPLIERLVSLSHLSLEGCSALTDEALIGVRNCRNLRWINISRTRLSDVALERCANLPRLTNINLSDCQHISDRGLTRIATQLGGLEALHLSKCRGITTKGIKMVICHSRGIQKLDLSRVKTVTDAVLRTIWSHCPYLRVLKISKCTRVTSRTCTALRDVYPTETLRGSRDHITKV
ncbi:hypothetical protein TcWFU_001005 [Taenia crassiceps]|uniref:F-box domain-containing protein n=1 Tax=Taenia crassiceps TaxID=6207 RepID=A0ABR4QFN1_9CEST